MCASSEGGEDIAFDLDLNPNLGCNRLANRRLTQDFPCPKNMS